MKSEPSVYSIDDLKKDRETSWDGIRNYQARNFMTNEMQVGDQVLFYHSNAEPPSVAGLAEVSALATADFTALDKKSPYFDERATREKPIWSCVKVRFKEKFKRTVSLDEIKKHSALSKMPLLQRGQRLSIQPVTEQEFKTICRLGNP